MNFTREQELAIRTRGINVMVSAGAGAGKTRVLVTRMAEQIMDESDPVDADRFLVMTFTRAAAAEMRERILKELQSRLEEEPENGRLRRQVRQIRHAQICTIHSFCSDLIRGHYQEIGLDPSFRIGEEGEMKLLSKKAMEQILEDAYQKRDADFLQFAEAFAPGREDGVLEGMIEDLYRFSNSAPDPSRYLQRSVAQAEALAEADGERIEALLGEYVDNARQKAGQYGAEFQALLSVQEEKSENIREDIKGILGILRSLADAESYADLCETLSGAVLPTIPHKKEEKAWPYYKAYKGLREALRKDLGAKMDLPFDRPVEQILAENKAMLPILRGCVARTEAFSEAYQALKTENNVYDYDDLEHFALQILTDGYEEDGTPIPSAAAKELTEKYREIYVDEYQDVSLIQETILRVITDPTKNHLFTVGDVKQSIYRFRQARPDLFLARSGRYVAAETPEKKQQNAPGIRIGLLDNFRSNAGVLSLINYIFERLMRRDFGGVDYDEKTALRVGAGSPMADDETTSEILLFSQEPGERDLPEKVEIESTMIASRIRDLLRAGYTYGDIVILLRSAPGWMQPMRDALIRRGIPAVCDLQEGFFDTREIRMMLNYLAVVDNVYQDIPMAACLLSGFGHFTEEDLARLRIYGKEKAFKQGKEEPPLYDLLKACRKEGPSESLRKKADHFLSMLEGFREEKQEVPLGRLLWDVYRKTGYYEEVQLLPGGEARKENLLMLLRQAQQYENTVFKGLFYFNRYIRQLQTYRIELGTAMSRPKDAVYIMTMHKSKGLEFPVVFVSGTGRDMNKREQRGAMVFHPRYGIGMNYVDIHHRISHSSLAKQQIARQIARENLEEELRVLYVAMTRAQKKLILTGITSEKTLQALERADLSRAEKEKANCYLDWILPALKDYPPLAAVLASRRDGGGTDGSDPEREISTDRMAHAASVRILHTADLPDLAQEEEKETGLMPFDQILTGQVLEEDATLAQKAFSFEYPHKGATKSKRKYSVSELKYLHQTELPEEEDGIVSGDLREEEVQKPAFLQESVPEVTPARRGTLVHKLMEQLPFGAIREEADLDRELTAILAGRPSVADAIDLSWFKRGAGAFLFSKTGERLREMDRKGHLKKEVPFSIGLPGFLPEDPEETVLIQGVIDLYARDEDGLWLIDYKTDAVRPGEENRLVDRYCRQMLYYKTALEQVSRIPVRYAALYSFRLRKFIPVDVSGGGDHGSDLR